MEVADEELMVGVKPMCPVCERTAVPLLCPPCVVKKTQRTNVAMEHSREVLEAAVARLENNLVNHIAILRLLQSTNRLRGEMRTMEEDNLIFSKKLEEEKKRLAEARKSNAECLERNRKLEARCKRTQKRQDQLHMKIQEKRGRCDMTSTSLIQCRRKHLLDWCQLFSPCGLCATSDMIWLCGTVGGLPPSASAEGSARPVAVSAAADKKQYEDVLMYSQYCSIVRIPLPRASEIWRLAQLECREVLEKDDQSLILRSAETSAPAILLSAKAAQLTLGLALHVLNTITNAHVVMPKEFEIDSPAYSGNSIPISVVHDTMVALDRFVLAFSSQQLNLQSDDTAVVLKQDSPIENLVSSLSASNPNLGHSGPFATDDSNGLQFESPIDLADVSGFVTLSPPPPVVEDVDSPNFSDWEWDGMANDFPVVPQPEAQDQVQEGIVNSAVSTLSGLFSNMPYFGRGGT